MAIGFARAYKLIRKYKLHEEKSKKMDNVSYRSSRCMNLGWIKKRGDLRGDISRHALKAGF